MPSADLFPPPLTGVCWKRVGGFRRASAALSPSELYERDYYKWLIEQACALRQRRVEDLDWANLAEEIEDLGKSEKRELRNQMARLIAHLLKFTHTVGRPFEANRRGGELTIRSARAEIVTLLEESPGLRSSLGEVFEAAYRRARLDALKATRLPDSAIPERAPWTYEQIIDDSFFPAR